MSRRFSHHGIGKELGISKNVVHITQKKHVDVGSVLDVKNTDRSLKLDKRYKIKSK